MADQWTVVDSYSCGEVIFASVTVTRPSGLRHYGVRIASDALDTLFLETSTPATAAHLLAVLVSHVLSATALSLPPEK
jgi:hypothetical protein